MKRLLRGLLYEHGQVDTLQEARRGAPIYAGQPDMSEEYKFKVNGKLAAIQYSVVEMKQFKHALVTHNTKEVKILSGHVVNLGNMRTRRVKRRTLTLVRKVR